jgi:hypothetical protein
MFRSNHHRGKGKSLLHRNEIARLDVDQKSDRRRKSGSKRRRRRVDRE